MNLPEGHEERIAENRSVAGYNVNNIYNEDESGLSYRVGPNRTHLGSHENRCDAPGTSFQKYKERLTVAFCTNADESHVLPIRYIGCTASRVCFRDNRNMKNSYSSQKSGCMDAAGLERWLH